MYIINRIKLLFLVIALFWVAPFVLIGKVAEMAMNFCIEKLHKVIDDESQRLWRS